jgi:hypothetical protein
MQNKEFLNSNSVKRTSIILDILLPLLLYWSINSHAIILPWLLLGAVILARVLLVLVIQ